MFVPLRFPSSPHVPFSRIGLNFAVDMFHTCARVLVGVVAKQLQSGPAILPGALRTIDPQGLTGHLSGVSFSSHLVEHHYESEAITHQVICSMEGVLVLDICIYHLTPEQC